MGKFSDGDLIAQAEEIFNSDKRFPLCYKAYVKSMKDYYEERGELSKGQREYLEELPPFHKEVVKVNKEITEERRGEIKMVLEDLLRFVKQGCDSGVSGYRTSVEVAIEQIKGGFYIWRNHLQRGIRLTEVLLEFHLGKGESEKKETTERFQETIKAYCKDMPLVLKSGNSRLANFFKWYYKTASIIPYPHKDEKYPRR